MSEKLEGFRYDGRKLIIDVTGGGVAECIPRGLSAEIVAARLRHLAIRLDQSVEARAAQETFSEAGGKGADETTAATEPVSRPASPPSTETRPIPMGGQHAAPPCFFCGHHLDKHAYNALGHPWRAGAAVTVADLALNR